MNRIIRAQWDVVGLNGTVLRAVSLPSSLVVHAIVGGAVYGVMKGAFDVEQVARFDVR